MQCCPCKNCLNRLGKKEPTMISLRFASLHMGIPAARSHTFREFEHDFRIRRIKIYRGKLHSALDQRIDAERSFTRNVSFVIGERNRDGRIPSLSVQSDACHACKFGPSQIMMLWAISRAQPGRPRSRLRVRPQSHRHQFPRRRGVTPSHLITKFTISTKPNNIRSNASYYALTK